KGDRTAMVFTDVGLAGEMDGVALAQNLGAHRPYVQVIVTSARRNDRVDALPDNVVYLAQPWRPLDVLIVAERARQAAESRARNSLPAERGTRRCRRMLRLRCGLTSANRLTTPCRRCACTRSGISCAPCHAGSWHQPGKSTPWKSPTVPPWWAPWAWPPS